MYSRILNLNKALLQKSHFLFGPRATGKSFLIQQQLAAEAQVFDLLHSDTFDRLLKRPSSLGEEIRSNLVVIDEIQKIPKLLDEVHRLIEERKIRFLLTGSSARKLKYGGANLLAGRARSLNLFPLVSYEISNFSLEKYCAFGGLPFIYLSDNPWEDLKAYTQLYLREEIMAEALVRKLDHFARFLDTVGLLSGQELNYQKIATEAQVPTRTVANFIEILKDTLLAFELESFHWGKKRKVVSKSKLYLFDVGVANFLSKRKNPLPKSEAFGVAFEHFIVQEIRAALFYQKIDEPLSYWRTQQGDYEVDCLIGKEVAIEIKSNELFHEKMLKGLIALGEEGLIKRRILVSRDSVERNIQGIEVMPVSTFLNLLWSQKLLL